ncbi:hypothetical protein [Pedobacter sp. ASV12]|uniref:hypothetical protein n=1 Tax=Pedobacter sp. ASV12 TaxID=2795120 RepID=UPI0018EDF773|nr:hypothetical protein [Pedobacter sp. ASV12]
MEDISVKQIVIAIEQYYDGKQIQEICDEYEIECFVFDNWLKEFKQIALEMMQMRNENHRLRKLFIEASLKNDSLNQRLQKLIWLRRNRVRHKCIVKWGKKK